MEAKKGKTKNKKVGNAKCFHALGKAGQNTRKRRHLKKKQETEREPHGGNVLDFKKGDQLKGKGCGLGIKKGHKEEASQGRERT